MTRGLVGQLGREMVEGKGSRVRVAKVLVLYANLFVCHTYWWATASKIFVGLVAQLVRAND